MGHSKIGADLVISIGSRSLFSGAFNIIRCVAAGHLYGFSPVSILKFDLKVSLLYGEMLLAVIEMIP